MSIAPNVWMCAMSDERLGYIKLFRTLSDNPIWVSKPFSKGQAWIDILLMVNFTDGICNINNDLIDIQAGQKITSILKLSNRWGWSRKKTDNFLKMLEKEKMLHTKRTTKYTVITIDNWELYQNREQLKEQQKSNKRTSTEHQKNIKRAQYKNDKKDKNVKNEKENTYCAFFDSVWELYPNKKGKSKVGKKAIEELQELGYDKLKQCIDAYVSQKPDWQQWQNGSTFFNGGYKDYLENETFDSTERISGLPGDTEWQ